MFYPGDVVVTKEDIGDEIGVTDDTIPMDTELTVLAEGMFGGGDIAVIYDNRDWNLTDDTVGLVKKGTHSAAIEELVKAGWFTDYDDRQKIINISIPLDDL